jgi:hypothetical protein
MKTLQIAALICYLFPSVLFSNECNINDFLLMRLADSNRVNQSITECNLELYDIDEIGRNKVHITYKNQDEIKKMQTYQWVDFIYCSKSHYRNRISFQIQNNTLLKKYLQEIIDLGFVYVRKKIVDRQIYEVFSNGKHTIDVITSQNRYVYDGGRYYNFAIYDTEEYEIVFKEENTKYSILEKEEERFVSFAAGIE